MKKEKYFGISPHIARWKNDTPFENWLSYRADSSEFFKRLYVLYYKHWNRKYYEGGLKMISQLIDERAELQELPRKALVNDMMYCLHRFGISFKNYCVYRFYEKNLFSRESYISDKLRYYYVDLLNKKSVSGLLSDKFKCYEVYKEFFGREAIACYSRNDRTTFLNFVKKITLLSISRCAAHLGVELKS